MITIPNTFGSGGANLVPGGAQGEPTLVNLLQEMQGLAFGFDITSADGVAAAGTPPTKAEYDAVVTLANEIKTAMDAYGAIWTSAAAALAAAAADPPVKAEFDLMVLLVNEQKAIINNVAKPGIVVSAADAVAAAADPITKSEFDVVVTLINEIKADLNAI